MRKRARVSYGELPGVMLPCEIVCSKSSTETVGPKRHATIFFIVATRNWISSCSAGEGMGSLATTAGAGAAVIV